MNPPCDARLPGPHAEEGCLCRARSSVRHFVCLHVRVQPRDVRRYHCDHLCALLRTKKYNRCCRVFPGSALDHGMRKVIANLVPGADATVSDHGRSRVARHPLNVNCLGPNIFNLVPDELPDARVNKETVR